MVFQSIDYLLFLIVVFAAYWSLPQRGQNVLLLVASYFFYGYIHPWYCFLIGTTTVMDWACARGMQARPEKKKMFLWMSLCTSFGMLGVFKYCGFFVENFVAVGRLVGLDLNDPVLRIALPAGISFHTFQSASYVIDVFRGKMQARRSLLDYAVFDSFFPQLVAGPIERAGHLLFQVEVKRRFDPWQVRQGLILILWGLFQKKCIADNTAVIVNKVFSLQENSFPVLWAGVLAFGVQIYADFSAYTNMARGSAKLLGFEICQNFNHPYLASSPTDFWRRWHISLSTWFRDYVYIPLGGNRVAPWLNVRNILITFGLSGLWHGAHWNYVLWGLFHGLLVAGWHLVETRAPAAATGGGRGGHLARVLATFVLVHVGWLMFREENLSHLSHMLTLSPFSATRETWEAGLYLAVQAVIFSVPMWIFPLVQRWAGVEGERLPAPPTWKRTMIDTGFAILLVLGLLVYASPLASDFIYFKF